MGSTSRFGLDYPDLTDAPNGPTQMKALAEGVEGWLCRAFPCTSSTRPTGMAAGFFIRESDTTNIMVWTGSAWAQVSGAVSSGGGSGGGTSAVGTVWAGWQAAAAQPIAASTDVVVSFPTAGGGDSAVTRSSSGAGHAFTLTQTRLWTVTATLRFAQNGVGGRTFELRAGSTVVAKASGPPDSDAPYTANLAVVRRFSAGTVITAVARHSSNQSVALEPNSGQYVHIDFGGV